MLQAWRQSARAVANQMIGVGFSRALKRRLGEGASPEGL